MREPALDESAMRMALETLDSRHSGYVEFDEFVDWWVGLCTPDRVKET